MRKLKVIAGVIVSVLVVIQLFRPRHNTSNGVQPSGIQRQMPIPDEVQALLKGACYDCHSNNTQYPWYVNFQPVAWLMAKHVKDGKTDLNFDEFGSYSERRQVSKLKSIANSLEDGSMPIASYRWMHKDARLSDNSKNSIIDWALQQKDSLEARQ